MRKAIEFHESMLTYRNPFTSGQFELTPEAKSFFKDNGYLVVPPGEVTAELLETAGKWARHYLPSWEAGFDDELKGVFPNPHLRSLFKYRDWLFSGCSLKHRRRSGLIPGSYDQNCLYGQRCALRGHSVIPGMAEVAETPMFLSVCKQLTIAREISLNNFSLINVYPGNTGDDNFFHSDLAGFSLNPMEANRKNQFTVLACIYLEDVDSKTAPLRLYPGSNKEYLRINDHIARLTQKDPKENQISSVNNFSELLPPDLRQPVNLVGKAGTVLFMDNNIIHQATGNLTKDKVRTTLFCSYSNREHLEINKKKYVAVPGFLASFADRELVRATFREKDSPQPIWRQMKNFLGGIKKRAQSLHENRDRSNRLKLLDPRSAEAIYIGVASKPFHNKLVYLDRNRKADLDFSFVPGVALPYPTDSLSLIYSSDYLEHIQEANAGPLLAECHRCLRSGGVLRLALLDADLFFDAYERRDHAFFDWIRNEPGFEKDSWLRLVLRHFVDPVVDFYSDEELYERYEREGYPQILDNLSKEIDERASGLQQGVFQSWWNHEKVIAVLCDQGFKEICATTRLQSGVKELRNPGYFDRHIPHARLFVEGVK